MADNIDNVVGTIVGYGVTIKGFTKAGKEFMKIKGVAEDVYLPKKDPSSKDAFSFVFPDTQDELRKTGVIKGGKEDALINVVIKGLPQDIVSGLQKVVGSGTKAPKEVTVTAYQETLTGNLTPARKFAGKVHVRVASASDGVQCQLADKAKVDTFTQDGQALYSSNINPLEGTITS